MMGNAAFKLEDSGFTRAQVEALMEFMSSNVATKEDIYRLEGKIDRLEGKMDTQNARLEGRIDGLEGKFTLLCWMFGVLVAGILALLLRSFV